MQCGDSPSRFPAIFHDVMRKCVRLAAEGYDLGDCPFDGTT